MWEELNKGRWLNWFTRVWPEPVVYPRRKLPNARNSADSECQLPSNNEFCTELTVSPAYRYWWYWHGVYSVRALLEKLSYLLLRDEGDGSSWVFDLAAWIRGLQCDDFEEQRLSFRRQHVNSLDSILTFEQSTGKEQEAVVQTRQHFPYWHIIGMVLNPCTFFTI